jgi:ubiquinone/menaquinone biosynthesis C-methylase UbiE
VSVSFDRAAEFYDATRGLPKQTAEAVTALLAAELSGRALTLEIGVGTGRIAAPLHELGQRIVGIDLSRAMLDMLVNKVSTPMPVAQADATALPFRDGVFDAAIVSHVFHLIPDWQSAAGELMRVLRPGSRLLVATGRDEDNGWHNVVRRQFWRNCGGTGIWDAYGERREHSADWLTRQATEHRDLPAIDVHQPWTIESYIDELASGHCSWTWSLAPEQLRKAAEATRAWAVEHLGALDEERDAHDIVTWVALTT